MISSVLVVSSLFFSFAIVYIRTRAQHDYIRYLREIGIDESLFETDEHRQRCDQLQLGVAEGVANGCKRPGAVRLAFLRRGRVHEQPDARHERGSDGHADETAAGEDAGQQLRGFACEQCEHEKTRFYS